MQREETTAGTMRTTALVKVSVARGRALPPEVHMIKCARQDFVLGEVRGKCVEDGSGGRYLYVLLIYCNGWVLIQNLREMPCMLGSLGTYPVQIMILEDRFLMTNFKSTSAIFKTLYLALNKLIIILKILILGGGGELWEDISGLLLYESRYVLER